MVRSIPWLLKSRSPALPVARLALAALAAFLVSCDDNDGPNPTPVSSAVPPVVTASGTNAPPEGCPLDPAEACEVALRVGKAIAFGETERFTGVVAPEAVECTGAAPSGVDPAASFCQGQPAGTVLEGYLSGPRGSDAISYVRSDAFALTDIVRQVAPEKTDPAGGGEPSLASVASDPACSGCFEFVYTWIAEVEVGELPDGGAAYGRPVLELGVQLDGDAATARYLWIGGVASERVLLTGGSYSGIDFERWPGDPLTLAAGDFLLGDTVTGSLSAGDCLALLEQPRTGSGIIACISLDQVGSVVDVAEPPAGGYWFRLYVNGPQQVDVGWAPAASLEAWPPQP